MCLPVREGQAPQAWHQHLVLVVAVGLQGAEGHGCAAGDDRGLFGGCNMKISVLCKGMTSATSSVSALAFSSSGKASAAPIDLQSRHGALALVRTLNRGCIRAR